MKNQILLSICILISSLAVGQTNPQFNPSFKVSQKTTHEIPKGQEYTFGYLSVLENRSNPNSRVIQLPVYIFKSRNPKPQPDPIIYTVGGPGSTTMPSAQYMKYYQYLDDRDFILIEQRGNYYAKPHLDCPEWAQAIYDSNLPPSDGDNSRVEGQKAQVGDEKSQVDAEMAENQFALAAKACRQRLTAQGIDLNGYNTNEIAADIADLVQVLGIDSYNLLTISYSTKIAQVLLRDYPEGIRSVVMDSPRSPKKPRIALKGISLLCKLKWNDLPLSYASDPWVNYWSITSRL